MFNLSEIIKASGGKHLSGPNDVNFPGVSDDSRKIKENELFVALIGQKYNGHSFTTEAFNKGALGAIVSSPEGEFPSAKVMIQVDDTLKALGELAKYHRQRFDIPIIAVTGSTGKTSTKEMIAAILSQRVDVLKSEENFNNEIGIPQTLLKLHPGHEAMVLEFGMRDLGEIKYLTEIALPTEVVITNIGVTHLEKLKTQKKIAEAKSEIFTSPKIFHGYLNTDDKFFDFLKKKIHPEKLRTFGMKKKALVHTNYIETKENSTFFMVKTKDLSKLIRLPLAGTHQVYNALAAISVALNLGFDIETIQEALNNIQPASLRQEIVEPPNGIRIINDTYNANPDSMKAALEVLSLQNAPRGFGKPRLIAALGDMLELGPISVKAHQKLGKILPKYRVEILVTVGDLAKEIANSVPKRKIKKENIYSLASNEEAAKKLKEIMQPNDVILVKGSRGMKMEEIVRGIIMD